MKEYSTLPKAPALLKPHHHQLISSTLVGGSFTSLQKCYRCTLQPQTTEQPDIIFINKKERNCHLEDFAVLVD